VDRLAAMTTAAPDFRPRWDNDCAVHHLTDERLEIPSIIGACARHGHPNRPFVSDRRRRSSSQDPAWLFASSAENVRTSRAWASGRSAGTGSTSFVTCAGSATRPGLQEGSAPRDDRLRPARDRRNRPHGCEGATSSRTSKSPAVSMVTGSLVRSMTVASSDDVGTRTEGRWTSDGASWQVRAARVADTTPARTL
jgi:hypothetical protein